MRVQFEARVPGTLSSSCSRQCWVRLVATCFRRAPVSHGPMISGVDRPRRCGTPGAIRWEAGLSRLRSRPVALARGLGQPAQPARQVPVPLAEKPHRGRQENAADQRRVDQHGSGKPNTELFQRQLRERREDREDEHHHGRRGPPPLARGEAGGSARRMYECLHERREKRAREKLGRLSGIYLALTDDPQSTRAWGVGSSGERRLGAYLDTLDDDESLIILHDRRAPGTRANIDHLAISRAGVFVIDAKNYTGKVQKIDRGGWFSSDARLYVGRRDCTNLVAGIRKQVEAVRNALGPAVIAELSPSVTSVLCFVDAEWSLFARPFQLEGVWVEWSKSLGERLRAPGPLTPEY